MSVACPQYLFRVTDPSFLALFQLRHFSNSAKVFFFFSISRKWPQNSVMWTAEWHPVSASSASFKLTLHKRLFQCLCTQWMNVPDTQICILSGMDKAGFISCGQLYGLGFSLDLHGHQASCKTANCNVLAVIWWSLNFAWLLIYILLNMGTR